jgi:hypothetical protein
VAWNEIDKSFYQSGKGNIHPAKKGNVFVADFILRIGLEKYERRVRPNAATMHKRSPRGRNRGGVNCPIPIGFHGLLAEWVFSIWRFCVG